MFVCIQLHIYFGSVKRTNTRNVCYSAREKMSRGKAIYLLLKSHIVYFIYSRISYITQT